MPTTPTFSKTAERRVKDRLAIPEQCPHCGGTVQLVDNCMVYGQSYGDWPWIYLCQSGACRAYVGTHPETNLPLGTLATAPIRAARKAAKERFNALWKEGGLTRTEAYGWLASKLDIPQAACHFGWFDEPQCKAALAVLDRESPPVFRSQRGNTALANLRAILAAGRQAR